ncbi:polysaccharide export protein [Ancylobacter sp. A5.8]|uniref:polysaccharide biosynthesis/export family protein n=1 Tax=Ancylobacter gelatini TaxID=2919920 RepID=UPI001F4DFD7A|nr:polysaccharide biosynthesis/export family protein [Ancylobacter gelatini]MCJ8141381.1 polysaccharide export protein [Ancylobacter gelatini]
MLLLAPAFIAISGCATVPSASSVPAGDQNAQTEYLLGTGDRLRVTVFNEPTLSGEFQVNASGIISMPLIGNIDAQGKSAHALETAIAQKLASGYMRDPRVNVEVLQYRPFYIIGEISKPGEYPYRNGMNIMSAVAVAGGFTYRANDQSVYIRRAGQTQEMSYPATTTTMVFPGDIVRIGERLF